MTRWAKLRRPVLYITETGSSSLPAGALVQVDPAGPDYRRIKFEGFLICVQEDSLDPLTVWERLAVESEL